MSSSAMIPSQKPVWDKKHSQGAHEGLRHSPSPFSEIAELYFPEKSKILELGCGVGRDAIFFEKKGHKVLATDVSEIAIKQNKEHFESSTVEWSVLDMNDPLQYEDESFDVVYINLSLHYYSDTKTKEIVQESARVLKPNGIFAYSCKSYDDAHNKGEEVEKNIFVSPTGVTIHLFSIDYAKSLLLPNFTEAYIDEIGEEYNGRFSKIVRCIARKNSIA
jgi:ubiquinone/menaquinone biosynthesis C-methylase UbiE